MKDTEENAEPIGGLISNEEAIKIAEEQGGSREELEAQPEAEEPAPETAGPSQKPANEMKIVIVMRDDRSMVGVQSPDCDPVYETMEGSLAKVLKQVPALVTKAKQQWAANPRYPKADLPEPPPSPTPARARTPAAPKTKPAQPSFF